MIFRKGYIASYDVFQYLPVTTIEQLPLRCNVGCYKGALTFVGVWEIPVRSQMTSSTELIFLDIEIDIKIALVVGSVVIM